MKWSGMIVVWGLLSLVTTATYAYNKNTCEPEFKALISGSKYPDLKSRLKQWQVLEPKCGGSGLYEFRLANLQIRAHAYKAAHITIRKGLRLHTPYRKMLLIALSDLADLQGNMAENKKLVEKIMEEYPNWFAGYQARGALGIEQGRYAEAIPYFKKAVSRNPKAWFSYGSLAIAYQRLGKNKEAISAIDKAFSIDQYDVGGQRDMMLAATRSYLSIGRPDIAHGVLLILMKYNPSEQRDPEAVKLMKYVKQALQNQKK